MPLQTAQANAVIDAIVNGSTFPSWGSTTFAALWSTTLTLTATSAATGEVSGGSYVRQPASFGAAANGAAANDAAIEFTTMPATTVYSVSLHTSSSAGGALIWQTTLTASKSVTAGDTVRFAIGALTATST